MAVEPVDALLLDPRDTVATALRALPAGARARIGTPSGPLQLVVREAIPLCHKIAVVALPAGAVAIKHGEPIGELTRPVEPGALVHVHNLLSRRARPSG